MSIRFANCESVVHIVWDDLVVVIYPSALGIPMSP